MSQRNTRLATVSILSSALIACGGGGPITKAGKIGDGGDQFANSHTTDGGGPAKVRDGGVSATTVLPTCGASHFAAEPVAANVLLVIDQSASMKDKPSGFDTDKWSAMKSSLGVALDAVKGKIALGLELYPQAHCELPAGSKMDVDVQPGDKALPLINSALQATTPTGGTPTAAALARALDYYTTGAGASLKGDKYVLLATDGGPNCNSGLSCDASACTVNLDNQCPMAVSNCCDPAMAGSGAQSGCLDDKETLARITALAAAGIDTFVIGIPGSESYATSLDAFAQGGARVNPGGPPSYYAVRGSGTGLDGLTSVLSTITGSLIKTCRLQLASVPPVIDQLNVQIDGKFVPQQGADGWKVDTSASPPAIDLLGKTCAALEQNGAQTVEIVYGCPTKIM